MYKAGRRNMLAHPGGTDDFFFMYFFLVPNSLDTITVKAKGDDTTVHVRGKRNTGALSKRRKHQRSTDDEFFRKVSLYKWHISCTDEYTFNDIGIRKWTFGCTSSVSENQEGGGRGFLLS